MATATTDLVTVQTRLDGETHRRLEERCDRFERSMAAEMRLALRAWVKGDADREPSTTKAAA